MGEFFKKNDKFLKNANLCLYVVSMLLVTFIIITAIFSFISGFVVLGIGLIVFGNITIIIFILIIKLILSFLIDIKLIRNKLYEEKSDKNDYKLDVENDFDYNTELIDFYNK